MKLPNFQSTKHSQGFTLIELMIVVVIIAILATVGAVIFTSVQKSSRDARRRADIESIAKALEVAKSTTNSETYPQLATTMFSTGLIPTDPGARSYCISPTGVATAPSAVPAAWTDNNCTGLSGYTKAVAGTPTTGATGFRICASLEDTTAAGTTAGVFCLSNQQ